MKGFQKGKRMRKFVFVVGLMMLSGMAFADPGGENSNTNCNGQGNVNSPCVPQNNGGGGDPGTPGNQNQSQGQAQAQQQGQQQGQAQAQFQNANATATATANATGGSGGAGGNATGGNASAMGGAVTNSGNSNATVGDVVNSASVGDVNNTNTNTANGGEGGSAVASTGDVTVNIQDGALRGAPVSLNTSTEYSYQEVRQAPSTAQGSFAISGCSVAGNAGGSSIRGSAFLGFGWTPQECYKFMLAQAYQSIGEKKAVCDILRNTKVGKRLERDGVELPDCEPKVVVIATPVAPEPVDLSPYATKEELNRAFRASQEK